MRIWSAIAIVTVFCYFRPHDPRAQSNLGTEKSSDQATTITAAEQETVQLLAQWKEDIHKQGTFASALDLKSNAYQKLYEKGPGILPALAKVYQEETDAFVLYHYGFLFQQIAGFQVYTYTDQSFAPDGLEFKDTEPAERPFLSAKREELFSDLNVSSMTAKRLYLEWWNRRGTFLKTPALKTELLSITGPDKNSLKQFSPQKSRALNKKVQIYGIYNIPIYFDLVSENNNAVAFCDFLRVVNHPEYRNLPMTNDPGKNAQIADDAYPTQKQKLYLMINWWTDSKSKFVELPDLNSEIEKHVNSLKPGQ